MGKYGLKIKSISAGTLYEYNLGVRDYYKYKNAMFTVSLLYDFLIENGLKVYKEKSTRDIVSLDFEWGSRSYESEVKHLNKIIEKNENNSEVVTKLNDRLEIVKQNKNKYKERSKKQIRDEYYNNGVSITYITKNKKGRIIREKTIHYKMLYRTTGKAKKGSCIFICDRLYKKAHKFLTMGLNIPDENAPIIELSAYSPLIASTIIDRIKINPNNILILKDVESEFETKIVSIETKDKKCVAIPIEKYTLKNTLFDGQALIDSSIFPEWADGYILLRHHMCKMASFNTNIQTFFKDYFKDNYDNAIVVDMFGNEHYAKDIELITTNNAMKWIKLNSTYNYWCKNVYKNNCMFGIVKTAHQSKLGNVQKMSYQMVNSLDYDSMKDIVKTSVDYVIQLKKDDNTFLEYLNKNFNFSNDYEVLIALVKQNKDFLRSEYFRRRKEFIIRSYVLNLKSGKLIQDADNLVIVGSPYAMLLHSVGEEAERDDTFKKEDGTIQCYTARFKNGDFLAGFRSPFNSKNNMSYLHNVYSDKMKKYFNFGKQVIAVNLIGNDFQDRNNGSDQDSDSLYTTNQPNIVSCAKKYYKEYPTIVNNIPKDPNKYNNHASQYALVDNSLAESSFSIGESSNLAQLALTYSYNFEEQKYSDAVCILSVLAQVAIDSAKRKSDVNISKEIKRIKSEIKVSENKYPDFWKIIRPKFNRNKINSTLKCPMNYLYDLKIPEFKPQTTTLPMSYFFKKFELDINRRKSKKVEELIEKYSLKLYDYNTDDKADECDYILLREDFKKLIEDISKIYISKNYLGLMSWLINRAFLITPDVDNNDKTIQTKLDKNKPILLKVLYSINPENLLKIFSKNM